MNDRLITVALSALTTVSVMQFAENEPTELTVDRLIVRKELIVSDTAQAWEPGFEKQQIPRGLYARSLWNGPGGLWVRSRLIKGEIDDPFDDRFHAIERDGSIRRAPGHISWNVWVDDAWRQMSIIQGEGVEPSELPLSQWSGQTHPGRLRFQTYRPGHGEPLTDAVLGQGKMSLGGGGYGGDGLPYPAEVLELWGGAFRTSPLRVPETPILVSDDGSGVHQYAVVAVGVQGDRTAPSPAVHTRGLATIRWDRVPGGDAYVVLRDGREIAGPLRIEGAQKFWTDLDRTPK